MGHHINWSDILVILEKKSTIVSSAEVSNFQPQTARHEAISQFNQAHWRLAAHASRLIRNQFLQVSRSKGIAWREGVPVRTPARS